MTQYNLFLVSGAVTVSDRPTRWWVDRRRYMLHVEISGTYTEGIFLTSPMLACVYVSRLIISFNLVKVKLNPYKNPYRKSIQLNRK